MTPTRTGSPASGRDRAGGRRGMTSRNRDSIPGCRGVSGYPGFGRVGNGADAGEAIAEMACGSSALAPESNDDTMDVNQELPAIQESPNIVATESPILPPMPDPEIVAEVICLTDMYEAARESAVLARTHRT